MAFCKAVVAIPACLALGAALLGACSEERAGGEPDASGGGGSGGDGGSPVVRPDSAEALYPTARALYERAVAPSCAGSEGSCHRGWAEPELSSFDAFVATAGAFCQAGAGDARAVVDGCERPGDRLVFADGVERAIVRVLVPEGAPRVPKAVTVELDGPAGDVRSAARVRAPVLPGQEEFREELRGVAITVLEPATRVALDLSGAAEGVAVEFDLRRWPRRGTDVVVADANGNGRSGGGELRQIAPGRPDRSYLYLRLLDDALGARMPLVESGWSSEATRALGCFVRGLPEGSQPDTSVADEPIRYDACPRDPGGSGGGVADFGAVERILVQRCAVGGCHGAEGAAGLDLRSDAFRSGAVIGRRSQEMPERALIEPGAPEASYLYCKIDPACGGRARGTALMPITGELGEEERAIVRTWIEAGAKLD